MTDANERDLNESSPLVGSEEQSLNDRDEDGLKMDSIEDIAESKSSLYLFLLTLSIGGLQVVWSVELSNGSPFLLSLGMSKALLAFVWIAGPITGVLVQPYIGIRSDNCRVSWGKRKPFMIAGGVATVVSLLALAWVQEVVGGFLGIFGVDSASTGARTTIIVVATILMYVLDFSINTVQAGIRCFIVDNAPAHQQESANAWASRLTGVGNILGYIFGYIELPKIFPFLGYTQFQVLSAIASVSLGATLVISCIYIQERDPRLEGPPTSKNLGVVDFFKQTFKSIRDLPPQIAKVCEVQLAAWVGWFPFLFYATTYVGQLYVNPLFDEHRDLSEEQINKAWEEATRIGTFALLVYAVISFVANITLPALVVPSYKPIVPDALEEEEQEPLTSTPFGNSQEPPQVAASRSKIPDSTEGPAWLSKLQIPGFTLRRAWLLSHVLFALCMFSTFFTNSYQSGTVVVGFVGISWALTLWAPFALISAEVARIDAEHRIRRRRHEITATIEGGVTTTNTGQGPTPYDPPADDHNDDDLETGSGLLHLKGAGEEENSAQAGIILGLHNVAISAPQILSSFICSAIFKAFQKPRGEPWDDSVGWAMRFGGCAALVAAWLTSRLAEGTRG